MTWYRTGTVNVTNNSKTVTGTNTGWSTIPTVSLVGSGFRGPDGRMYEIEAVNGATSLTLVEPYMSASANNQAYALMPTLGLASDLALAVSQLLARTANTIDTATPLGKTLLAIPSAPDARDAIGVGQEIVDKVGGAWTSGGTGIAPTSGTFANANATVTYKKVGRTVFFTLTVSIISNGSGAGAVRVTLPFYANQSAVFAGRENASTGAQLQALLSASQNTLFIFRYDNGYPGGDNRSLVVSGVYEANA